MWSDRWIYLCVDRCCRELGIGVVPYSPLGRGFFAGIKKEELTDDDFRKVTTFSLYCFQ